MPEQNRDEQTRIQTSNLSLLALNFVEQDENRDVYYRFEPPTLKEVENYQKEKNALHPKVAEMIEGDAAMRLYAAILLSRTDREKSDYLLNQLLDDETEIKVQHPIGHGATSIAVKYPARGFLKTGSIRSGFVETAEMLNKWKIAVQAEADQKKLPPKFEELPTAEQIIDAAEGAEETEKVKIRLRQLADSEFISKRFYAVAGFEFIDKEECREILESLLEDETPVTIISGDITYPLPANQIARELLNPAQATEPRNPTLFQRVRQRLFDKGE